MNSTALFKCYKYVAELCCYLVRAEGSGEGSWLQTSLMPVRGMSSSRLMSAAYKAMTTERKRAHTKQYQLQVKLGVQVLAKALSGSE